MIDHEVIARQAEHDRIAQQIDEYLRGGGTITVLAQKDVSERKGPYPYNERAKDFRHAE